MYVIVLNSFLKSIVKIFMIILIYPDNGNLPLSSFPKIMIRDNILCCLLIEIWTWYGASWKIEGSTVLLGIRPLGTSKIQYDTTLLSDYTEFPSNTSSNCQDNSV